MEEEIKHGWQENVLRISVLCVRDDQKLPKGIHESPVHCLEKESQTQRCDNTAQEIELQNQNKGLDAIENIVLMQCLLGWTHT